MWTTIQIILGLLGVLFLLGGDRLSMPILSYAGMAGLGLAAMAILQGLQFNLMVYS